MVALAPAYGNGEADQLKVESPNQRAHAGGQSYPAALDAAHLLDKFIVSLARGPQPSDPGTLAGFGGFTTKLQLRDPPKKYNFWQIWREGALGRLRAMEGLTSQIHRLSPLPLSFFC